MSNSNTPRGIDEIIDRLNAATVQLRAMNDKDFPNPFYKLGDMLFADCIDSLETRVHNLNLYLRYVQLHAPKLFARMLNEFSGMSGYSEEEAKHE